MESAGLVLRVAVGLLVLGAEFEGGAGEGMSTGVDLDATCAELGTALKSGVDSTATGVGSVLEASVLMGWSVLVLGGPSGEGQGSGLGT